MLSIDELIQPLTSDQVLQSWLDSLESLGIRANSWRKAGVARSILRVVAAMYAAFTLLMAQAIRSGFLDLAEGAWLTLLAYYVYGVTRKEATFATGQVTLVNTGGGIYDYEPNTFVMKRSDNDRAYTNVDAFHLGSGDTLEIDVIALDIGAVGSAPATAVDTLVTALIGVTCENEEAIVGSDAQTDTDLRQECRDKLGASSNRGPKGAYASAIRSATRVGGLPVDINRISISEASSKGIVTIYVAAPAGAPITEDVDAITDSINELARPGAVTVNVNPATEVAYSRSLTVWAKRTDGVSSDDIKDAVDNAIINLSRSYPIGGIAKPPGDLQGYLYATTVEGTAESAHPTIYAVDGAGADLALNTGEVAVMAVTVAVRLVEVEVTV